MIGVDLAVALGRLQLDSSGFHLAGDVLTDVLHRGKIAVVVLQGIKGMGIRGNDLGHAGIENRIRVLILEILKEHFFSEAPDLVAAVLFGLAENPEILAGSSQDLGRGPADILHTVVIGGDAVQKIEGFRTFLLAQDLDLDPFGKLLGPVRPLLFHLAPGIAPFLQRP